MTAIETTKRKHLIGGTDAASLIGMGRESPVALYLRLRHGMDGRDNGFADALRAGQLFEDGVVVPLAKERLGLTLVRPAPRTMTLPDEPRIGASLDFVVSGTGHLADAKLTSSRALWGQLGEKVPLHVGAQMQFQMAVARACGWIVPCDHVIACFVPGFVMQDFEVEEDRAVGEGLLDRARQMLDRVDRGVPPDATSEADARALFLANRGERIVLPDEMEQVLAEIMHEEAVVKRAEKRIKERRDILLPFLGTATEVFGKDGLEIATWRPNKVFDEARFIDRHPDIAMECSKAVLDLAKLRREHRKLAAEFMVEPTDQAEQTRVLRIKYSGEAGDESHG